MTATPDQVLEAYGWGNAALAPVPGGLINQTFALRRGGERAILQRLHPVFGAEVHVDIEAITGHLAAHGLVTPRLIRTRAGALWVEAEGEVWRMLSYVEGRTLHRVGDPAEARAAGELVARFHAAVGDLDHEFAFARAGVHDTSAHLAKLEQVAGASDDADARSLAERILEAARALEPLGELPRRICHGDLKISNVLFAHRAVAARCLIDLDTLGHQSLAYELGDALRSWCNPRGEDVTVARLDEAIFAAAVEGYAGGGAALEPDERDSLVLGLATVCVELAARFCTDAVEDSYFGWDAARFPSRRAHNLERARGQLALAASVSDRRAALERIARERLGR